MDNCIFCEIAKATSKYDVIYNDEKMFVMLDRDWAVKGHSLVIWKKHFDNASELPIKDFIHFSKVFYKTERVLLNKLKVDKSIILKSGGLVSHFHFHIYPVNSEISWQQAKDMFDKKVKYQTTEKERNEFISALKEELK